MATDGGPDTRHESLEDPFIASQIIIPNAAHLQRLKAKLQEYYGRPAYNPHLDTVDDTTLAVHGFTAVHHLFKQATLDAVIRLAETEDRDTLIAPITMAEVAAQFRMATGVDVSDAVVGPGAVQFVYDSEKNWHLPEFAPHNDETDSLPTLFVAAYGIARAYAWGRLDVVIGGTGLPPAAGIPAQPISTSGPPVVQQQEQPHVRRPRNPL